MLICHVMRTFLKHVRLISTLRAAWGTISAPTLWYATPLLDQERSVGSVVVEDLNLRQSSDFKPLISSVQLKEKADRSNFFLMPWVSQGANGVEISSQAPVAGKVGDFCYGSSSSCTQRPLPSPFYLRSFITWSLFLHMVHFGPKACQHTLVYIM